MLHKIHSRHRQPWLQISVPVVYQPYDLDLSKSQLPCLLSKVIKSTYLIWLSWGLNKVNYIRDLVACLVDSKYWRKGSYYIIRTIIIIISVIVTVKLFGFQVSKALSLSSLHSLSWGQSQQGYILNGPFSPGLTAIPQGDGVHPVWHTTWEGKLGPPVPSLWSLIFSFWPCPAWPRSDSWSCCALGSR